MRDQDVWWSLQPPADEDSNAYGAEARRQDGLGVQPRNTATQGGTAAKLTRFYDPLTLLGQATGVNGELLALSGERNPYPARWAASRRAPGPTCWWPTAIPQPISISWRIPTRTCA